MDTNGLITLGEAAEKLGISQSNMSYLKKLPSFPQQVINRNSEDSRKKYFLWEEIKEWYEARLTLKESYVSEYNMRKEYSGRIRKRKPISPQLD